MFRPNPRITDKPDPEYVLQSIREGNYNYVGPLISAELITATAHSFAERHMVRLTLEDISGIIVELQKSQPQLKTYGIAMRRVPHGYYSEDIEAFFGRLCGSDYAKAQEGGVRLNDKDWKLYQEIIGEFFSEHPLVFLEFASSIWQTMYPKFFKAPIV